MWRRLPGFIDRATRQFQESIRRSRELRAEYDELMRAALQGGGTRAVDRHVKTNRKILPRERLRMLLDEDSDFLELNALTGMRMEYGDVPTGGAIAGIGRVNGVYCVVSASEATVKGGTMYPISVKKTIQLGELIESLKLPSINLIDTGGAFLPLQAEIFPDRRHGGRAFYNEALLNARGVPQVVVVVGSCTAGGAYFPVMAQTNIIVERIGHIFLGGPPLVQAATGERVTPDELGGAKLHTRVSGCSDYYATHEDEAIRIARELMAFTYRDERVVFESSSPKKVEPTLFQKASAAAKAKNSYEEPLYDLSELNGLLPNVCEEGQDSATRRSIVYQILARVVDGSRVHEFRTTYGDGAVCAFAELGGHRVGLVANTGRLCAPTAAKCAHFVQLCNQQAIPLVFLQNISSANFDGLLQSDGDENDQPLPLDAARFGETYAAWSQAVPAHAALMQAVCTARVPKVTFVIGNAYPPFSYMFASKSTGADFLFSWPNARFSALPHRHLRSELRRQMESDTTPDGANIDEVATHIAAQSTAFHATANAHDDGVILPEQTRVTAIRCLNAIRAARRQEDLLNERRKLYLRDENGEYVPNSWPVFRM